MPRPKMEMKKVEVRRNDEGQWFYRGRGVNNKKIGTSGETYKNLSDCLRAVQGMTDADARGIPVIIHE